MFTYSPIPSFIEQISIEYLVYARHLASARDMIENRAGMISLLLKFTVVGMLCLEDTRNKRRRKSRVAVFNLSWRNGCCSSLLLISETPEPGVLK
jgi:hypothetical protein